MAERDGPVLIDLDEDAPGPSPADAAPVPELDPATREAAMVQVAALAASKPSPLSRWFWSLLATILGFVISVAAWRFVEGLLLASPLLGFVALVLLACFALVLLIIAVKELAAFNRLKRLDDIHRGAAEALTNHDLTGARKVADSVVALYAGRPDTEWGRARFAERRAEVMDADGLLGLIETDILVPLDQRAMREVEASARQVATVTAVVPLAFADVITALTANLRMIRRVAEVYGGRSGGLSAWRLTRSVFTHLIATGAVAVGDDLVGSVAGGGLLARVSRRFGEGVVNGALTARVGVAAIEVCRPLPFGAVKRPSVTALVRRALTGLFGERE
ncbi:YcjF family protein [Pelagovum pacificum]|uniref:TIGR01620 family protein n=1 Tax=Pelagovum pacificum TaxID=2588711 RepID=A0A5C5G869_9RHOB|nr:TIGR01620 family protein [Pelagovum pacificum]QQA41684.1 TIGR01620 family protein [Pelagovum pacificum]TNY30963.1 TIGR01620 family protein [Pelagovum pacificum]